MSSPSLRLGPSLRAARGDRQARKVGVCSAMVGLAERSETGERYRSPTAVPDSPWVTGWPTGLARRQIPHIAVGPSSDRPLPHQPSSSFSTSSSLSVGLWLLDPLPQDLGHPGGLSHATGHFAHQPAPEAQGTHRGTGAQQDRADKLAAASPPLRSSSCVSGAPGHLRTCVCC